MHYTICSQGREAVISTTGAELQSLTDRESGEEFLWQGDPAIWNGRAPILFPVVGSLKEDRFQHGDSDYEMVPHGFARRSEFDCVEASTDRLKLSLRASPATLRHYPWDFSLQIDFFWRLDQLVIEYTVINMNEREMLFNIGSHPAFILPLENARIEDYQIEFSEAETLDTWAIVNRLLESPPRPFLSDQRAFPLSSTLFDNDALVFMNVRSNVVSLRHRDHDTRISVETGGAPHLGIWAKPAAPYVCIEPWWGYADLATADGILANKAGIQRLAAGGVFSTYIAIDTRLN
ncbi:MAG: aldose 1-epimerase family protein [Granulosicoccus sp.]|nr:aldose 1-epimerase family protein [Granulosicoccus sp.]